MKNGTVNSTGYPPDVHPGNLPSSGALRISSNKARAKMLCLTLLATALLALKTISFLQPARTNLGFAV
jgi:hypothetical protein